MAETKSPWIVDVGEENFEREVIEHSRQQPVVVDFWAPWCGPCRILGPILEKLIDARQGSMRLAKINVDEAQNLAAAFRIDSIPAVKAIRDGKVVLEFVGMMPEGEVGRFLDRLVPTETELLAKQAVELESKQPADAEPLYRRILEKEPDHPVALLGLARLLIAKNEDAEVPVLLDRVASYDDKPEVDRLRSLLFLREQAQSLGAEATLRRKLQDKPNDARLQYELGVVLAVAGRYKEALDTLLAAGGKDEKLRYEEVKAAMVDIFRVIGVRDPLADEYREKLTRMLY